MIPRHLGRYEIQGQIGHGAMGRVYRAYDPLCRRWVAIKTIKSEFLSERSSREYVARFRREAHAAGTLSHPNIVAVYDISRDYFVMEYLEGQTLLALLTQRGPLTPEDAIVIAAPIAHALDYAHQHGIIHRDVKPSNLMILPGGQPKIMDFGVAHLESTLMTSAGQSLGSPPYMAPEQILGGEATPRSDLFSLAVVTYEMLTARRPFEGRSITSILYRVINQPPTRPSRWNPSLPSRYDDVFRVALSKRPEERFTSGAELLKALRLSSEERPLPSPIAHQPPAVGCDDTRTTPTLRRVTRSARRRARPRAGLRPISVGLLRKLRRATVVATSILLGATALAIATLFFKAEPLPGFASPGPAILRVETLPPGANVWLNGHELGVSPITVTSPPTGSASLRVAKDGFLPVEEHIELSTTPEQVHLELMPAPTRLFVRSEPAGARVRIDGKTVGVAPVNDLVIVPGPHEVRVERRGYRPWTFDIDADAGESVHLLAPLADAGATPVAQAKPEVEPTSRMESLLEVRAGGTVPRKISGEFASYPSEAIERGDQGTVVVDMIISTGGRPVELRVRQSAGPVLDRAVLEAVWQWRFEPAKKDGVPVRARWQMSQSFYRADGTPSSITRALDRHSDGHQIVRVTFVGGPGSRAQSPLGCQRPTMRLRVVRSGSGDRLDQFPGLLGRPYRVG